MGAVPNTIISALTFFGVIYDTNNTIFGRSNASERIANDTFKYNFNTCIYLKLSDLGEHCKMYGSLIVGEGRIRLRPMTKVNIRDLFHWVKDRIMMSEDPAATPFPKVDKDHLIER